MFNFILFVLAGLLSMVAAALTISFVFGGLYPLAAIAFIHFCAGCYMVSAFIRAEAAA